MMNEIDFSRKPVLTGNKVVLRPFEDKDCDHMLRILEEPELRRLTGSVADDEEANEPTSPEEREEIIQWYHSRNLQSDRLDLAVIDRESQELVGEVVFNMYEKATGIVNFRILLSRSGCNKGIGTEATSLFLKYGFEELGLHKVELEVYSFNPRAERVYQKNGFVLEGVKRKNFRYNQEYYDTHVYGMLKTDYVKGRLS